ncbi:MAG: ABC transporter permease [Lachnospiraceae bacterium]|nr:ABC transporter permease [Lachnospiraceae bacterium]MBR2532305.1 ABC transporter permease [Lachnospiraceae bacterium]
MRASDLIILAIRNLLRRKTRTVLTVLGVVIGTASIVVMMSLGLGMSRSMVELYQSFGSLTTISVYSYGTDDNTKEITDETVRSFARLPHVEASSPLLQVDVEARSGSAEGYITLYGVSQEYLQQIELGSGRLPAPDQAELELVYGNMAPRMFYKSSRSGERNYGDGEILVDPMKDTIFYVFPEGSAAQARGGSGASSQASSAGSSAPSRKKYMLPAVGMVKGGPEDYNEFSWDVYCDIDTLKTFLKKIYKKNLVPYPRTNKKGKPVNYYVYNQAYIFVDKMENVSLVQQQVSDMGYQANSNMQWLEQSQQTMKMVEAVLGGIGAVSLLVAAIGIVNTMMMSIYERTREIGIMKVLGCDMNDIRNLFLTESGAIGFLGGVTGLLASCGVSALINRLAGSIEQGLGPVISSGGGISYIPPWLGAFSVLFAIGIGTVAGYIPAKRAMRLSPLAAIRNE